MRSIVALTPLLSLLPTLVLAQYGGGGGGPSTTSSSSTSSKTSTTSAASKTSTSASASSSPSASAASSGSGSGDVFDVVLGQNGQFTFTPNKLQVDTGDIIQFHFTGGIAHSVNLGTFDTPCAPNPTNAISSGAINGPSGSQASQMFVVPVNDSSTQIFYCGNPGHCQLGMALILNEATNNASQTLASYQAAAKNVQTTSAEGVSGGQLEANRQGAASSNSSSSASGSSSASASSASASAKGNGAISEKAAGHGKALAGMVVGVLGLIVAGGMM